MPVFDIAPKFVVAPAMADDPPRPPRDKMRLSGLLNAPSTPPLSSPPAQRQRLPSIRMSPPPSAVGGVGATSPTPKRARTTPTPPPDAQDQAPYAAVLGTPALSVATLQHTGAPLSVAGPSMEAGRGRGGGSGSIGGAGAAGPSSSECESCGKVFRTRQGCFRHFQTVQYVFCAKSHAQLNLLKTRRGESQMTTDGEIELGSSTKMLLASLLCQLVVAILRHWSVVLAQVTDLAIVFTFVTYSIYLNLRLRACVCPPCLFFDVSIASDLRCECSTCTRYLVTRVLSAFRPSALPSPNVSSTPRAIAENHSTLPSIDARASQKKRPHKCDRCGANFGQKCSLQRHVKAVHADADVRFRCEHTDCAWAFSEYRLLQAHIKQFHDGVPPFVCAHPACAACFMWVASFHAHMADAHGVLPPVEAVDGGEGGGSGGSAEPTAGRPQ